MKPSEFFIGVVDLFAILLPGAIATWIAIHFSESHELPLLVNMGLSGLTGAAAWIAFFVCAYIVGHLGHTVSSYLDHLSWVKRAGQKLVSELDPSAANRADAVKNAQALLLMIRPDALTEVRRLEADSKFFRSLVVVLALVLVRLLLGLNALVHCAAAVVCLVLIALSLLCYRERRQKAIALSIRLSLVARQSERAGGDAQAASAGSQTW